LHDLGVDESARQIQLMRKSAREHRQRLNPDSLAMDLSLSLGSILGIIGVVNAVLAEAEATSADCVAPKL
jgi:hypothetical protein